MLTSNVARGVQGRRQGTEAVDDKTEGREKGFFVILRRSEPQGCQATAAVGSSCLLLLTGSWIQMTLTKVIGLAGAQGQGVHQADCDQDVNASLSNLDCDSTSCHGTSCQEARGYQTSRHEAEGHQARCHQASGVEGDISLAAEERRQDPCAEAREGSCDCSIKECSAGNEEAHRSEGFFCWSDR